MKNDLQGLLRMNLQLLAEDTGAGEGTGETHQRRTSQRVKLTQMKSCRN